MERWSPDFQGTSEIIRFFRHRDLLFAYFLPRLPGGLESEITHGRLREHFLTRGRNTQPKKPLLEAPCGALSGVK